MPTTNDEPAWVEFDAVVETVVWGRSTYTLLRLEDRLADAARAWGTRRVEGTVDGVEVNLGVNRADVLPDAFAYAGRPLLARLGVRPGELVECRLRPADPDVVPVPEDVATALADAGLDDAFEAVPAPRRRRLLQPVEDAVRPATRAARIEALLREL